MSDVALITVTVQGYQDHLTTTKDGIRLQIVGALSATLQGTRVPGDDLPSIHRMKNQIGAHIITELADQLTAQVLHQVPDGLNLTKQANDTWQSILDLDGITSDELRAQLVDQIDWLAGADDWVDQVYPVIHPLVKRHFAVATQLREKLLAIYRQAPYQTLQLPTNAIVNAVLTDEEEGLQ